MRHVITLIAAENTLASADGAVTLLAAQGISAQPQWLEEGTACDLMFDAHDVEMLHPMLQQYCEERHCDYILQPAENRRKKLLISDMDSTMIDQECIDELADVVGLKTKVAAITERAMNGELDFASALRERVALLKGLRETDLQRVLETRITPMRGARTLVQTMRAHGAHTLLVSGGFTFFTQAVAAMLGFHADHANILEIKDGQLTGQVIEPILGKEAKLASLQQATREHKLLNDDVLAVGDGANDLPMLQAAGLGVAYHAKPVVRAATHAAINHGDLTALLYAQGYASKDWAK